MFARAAIVPLGIDWIGDRVALVHCQQVLVRYSGVTALGLMVGPLMGGLLAQLLSWRLVFMFLAISFAVMSAVLWTRLRQPESATADANPGVARKPYLQQVKDLLADPWARRIRAAGYAEAVIGMGCLAFLPTVLHDKFGLTLLEAGAAAASFGMGGFLFSRAAAPLFRQIRPHPAGRRKPVAGSGLRATGAHAALGLGRAGMRHGGFWILRNAQHPADAGHPAVPRRDWACGVTVHR